MTLGVYLESPMWDDPHSVEQHGACMTEYAKQYVRVREGVCVCESVCMCESV